MADYLKKLSDMQLKCKDCIFAKEETNSNFNNTFLCELELPPWVAATSNGPRRVEAYESCSLGVRRG